MASRTIAAGLHTTNYSAFFPFGSSYTITNLGTVSVANGIGVYFQGGTGIFINLGGVTAPGVGVDLTTGGTVINHGSIVSTSGNAIEDRAVQPLIVYNSGLIKAVTNASVSAIYSSLGGSVTNVAGGTITGAYGVVLRLGLGTVLNNGLISGFNHVAAHGQDGVGLGAGGSVTNQVSGTIGGYLGVSIAGGAGTVTNAGVIYGVNTAVTLPAGFANRVVFEPGASFTGVVSGGNPIGVPVSSTLELASGASTGTLNGLGSQYIDFAQIKIDAGANWALSGSSNTVVLGVTLTNAGTVNGSAGTKSSAVGGVGGGGPPAVQVATGGSLSNSGNVAGGVGGNGGYGFDGIPLAEAGGAGGAGGQGAAGAVANGGTVGNSGSLSGGTGGTGGTGGAGAVFSRGGGGGAGGTGGAGISLASGGQFANTATVSGGTGGNGGIGGPGGTPGSGPGGAGGAGGSGVYGTTGTIANAGLIEGGGGGSGGTGSTAGAAGAGGAGISFTGGGVVTNQSGGSIAGSSGADAIAFGTGTSQLVVDPGASFSGVVDGGNPLGSATISTLQLASAATAGVLSGALGTQYIDFAQVTVAAGAQWTLGGGGALSGVVLTVGGTLTTTAALTNSGTALGFGVTLATGGELINKSNITANNDNAVSGRAGAITVVNSGQLNGNRSAATGVYMFGGGLLTNTGGNIQALYGVRGGGASASAAITIVNSALIVSNANSAGAGIYLLAGGSVTNQQNGQVQAMDATGDGVRAKSQPITVVNSGQIQGGNNSADSGITLAAGGVVTNLTQGQIQGGYGIAATGGATTVVNYGKLTGHAAADFAVRLGAGFANLVVLHPADGVNGTVSGGNTIGATAVSTLELAANTKAATGGLSSFGTKYIDFAQVIVDAGAHWNLNGSNTVAYGVTLTDSGTLTNTATLLAGTGAAGGNSGAVGASGTAGQAGALAVTVASTGSLSNTGTISGGDGGAGGAGVAGAPTDQDVGGSGAAGGIGIVAVRAAAGAIVTNTGIVTGGSGGAGGTGGDAGGSAANDGGAGGAGAAGAAGIYLSGGTLTNQATITGGAGGVGGNAGAYFNSTGSGAAGGAGGAGVFGLTGIVINNGVIGGAAGGAGGSGGTAGTSGITGAYGAGVSFSAGGTVTNAGSIIGAGGADAIEFGAGPSRLIYVPGATFTGTVDGGNTIGAASISTLELTTTTSAGSLSAEGTLAGLGTEFMNFAQVLVDPGAIWTLTSTDSLATGATLTDNGVLLDSGHAIAGGGAVTIAGTAGIIASETVTASGAWSGMSQLVVGGAGDGSFLVSNAGTAGAANLDVAAGAGGAGAITVTGTSSLLSSTGSVTVGDAGLGSLSIEAGGSVSAASLLVGNGAGADGSSADISGAGAQLTVTGLLQVGAAGTGSLQITDGAAVTAGSLDGAQSAAAVANISVSGAGSSLTMTGAATVADDGTGLLSVLSGATFAATNLTIGALTDSSGAMVVSGTGSTVNLTGALNIGTALGTGDLTVGPGAAIHAGVINQFGDVVDEGGLLDPTVLLDEGTDGGTGTIASDFIIDEGTIAANSKKAANGVEVVSGTVVGGGTLTISGGTTLDGTTQNSPGLLLLDNIGTLEVQGPVLNAADTTFMDNGTPNGAVTVFGTYDVANSVVDVAFLKANEVLVLDDISGFAGTLTGLFGGDRIVITGGTLANLGVSNGDTLTMDDSGAGAGTGGTDRIMAASGVNLAGLSIVNGNTLEILACFAEGTLIETEDGPVAVEDLCVGDQAVTADGGCEPIVWIGQRAVNCARHPKPDTVWPVRVSAGAFGENVPDRDLYLSPDHAVFVTNALVPVKLLINDTSIAQVKRDEVRYYHVELPRHAVILADGLPVESYLDTGDRTDFGQDGVLRLYPNFAAGLAPDAAMTWETRGAAPLVMAGEKLGAARATIRTNAVLGDFRLERTRSRAV